MGGGLNVAVSRYHNIDADVGNEGSAFFDLHHATAVEAADSACISSIPIIAFGMASQNGFA